MRLVLGLAGLAAVTVITAAAPAFADAMKFACARDATVRTVSVVNDPGKGYACEVQYAKTSEGQGPQTLWHAENDKSFCAKQAQALVQRLGEAGWTCNAEGSTVAETPSPAQPKAAEMARPKLTKVDAESVPAQPPTPQAEAAKMPEPFAAPVPVGAPNPQGITAAVQQDMPIDDQNAGADGDRAPIDPDHDPAATHAPPGHSAGSFALRPTLH